MCLTDLPSRAHSLSTCLASPCFKCCYEVYEEHLHKSWFTRVYHTAIDDTYNQYDSQDDTYASYRPLSRPSTPIPSDSDDAPFLEDEASDVWSPWDFDDGSHRDDYGVGSDSGMPMECNYDGNYIHSHDHPHNDHIYGNERYDLPRLEHKWYSPVYDLFDDDDDPCCDGCDMISDCGTAGDKSYDYDSDYGYEHLSEDNYFDHSHRNRDWDLLSRLD